MGRRKLSPEERAPRRPHPRGAARPPEPTPTPEQHARTRELLSRWAEEGGWPAPRPGWQRDLARRLGVKPGTLSLIWRGVRVMPPGWAGRMARGGEVAQ